MATMASDDDDTEPQQHRQNGKVRRKKMKSILPDHLDVIEEDLEEENLFEIDSISSSCSSTSNASRNRSIAVDGYTTLSQKLLTYDNHHQQSYPNYMKTTKYLTGEDDGIVAATAASGAASHSTEGSDCVNTSERRNRVGRTRSRTSINQEDLFTEATMQGNAGIVGETSSEGTSKTIDTEECTDDGCSSRSSYCSQSSDEGIKRVQMSAISERLESNENDASSSSSSSSSSSASSISQRQLRIDYGLDAKNVDQAELWENASCNGSMASNYNYDDEGIDIFDDNKGNDSGTEMALDKDGTDGDNIKEDDTQQNKRRTQVIPQHENSVTREILTKSQPISEPIGKNKDKETKTTTREMINLENDNIRTSQHEGQGFSSTHNTSIRMNSITTIAALASGEESSPKIIRSSSSVSSKHSATSTISLLSLSEHDRSFHNVHDDDEDEIPWRMDPMESLSDWTIVVKVKPSNEIQTYHVHKNFLGLGSRKSEFFLNIFKNSKNTATATSNNTTELELLQPAAIVMPSVLDYIYADKLVITTQSVLGLRFLSQVFGIKQLFLKVMEFIQHDLSLNTIAMYYVTSTQLGDQKIRNIASRHFGRNVLKIDQSHPLLKFMDPYFFSSTLIYIAKNENVRKKLHASLLVAEYCKLQQESLDYDLFLMLTNEDHLQVIHYSAALDILKMELHYSKSKSRSSSTNNETSNIGTSNIRERSIIAIAGKWKLLCEKYPEQTISACMQLPSTIISDILVRSLQQTKKSRRMSLSSTYSGCSASQNSNTSTGDNDVDQFRISARHGPMNTDNISDEISEQSVSTKNQRKVAQGNVTGQLKSKKVPPGNKKSNQDPVSYIGTKPNHLVDASTKNTQSHNVATDNQTHKDTPTSEQSYDYQNEIVKLQQLCIEKEKEISILKTELGRFRRLPNKLNGKLVKSGSKVVPSVLPSIIPVSDEGHILSSSEDTGQKYPLFYYKS
jgi:BTB/POZ domain